MNGYTIPGYAHKRVALFVPEFSHIWTNPDCSRFEVRKVLLEEFIHSAQTSFRPSLFLPLRNFLLQSPQHPGHEDFRDLVECVFCLAIPITFDLPIHDKALPRHCAQKELASRCIALATRFATHSSSKEVGEGPKREALWAIMVVLLNVVPLTTNQGPFVISKLETLQPTDEWSTATELANSLLGYLFEGLQRLAPEQRTFTVLPFNDSHELLFRAVDAVHDFVHAPLTRVRATIPLLLSVLSLDVFRRVHVLYLLRRQGRIGASVELWDFTIQNVRDLTTMFEAAQRTKTDPSLCAAQQIHIKLCAFLGNLYSQKTTWSMPHLAHELLELFPQLLRLINYQEKSSTAFCPRCQRTFGDRVFSERVIELTSLDRVTKLRLIEAAASYDHWLRSDCLRLAKDAFGLPSSRRVEMLPVTQKAEHASQGVHSYKYPTSGAIVGQFVPALGQIWILPECPNQLLDQILAHEQLHFNFCGLQPSQLVPMHSVLLNRFGPSARLFSDFVEVGYVVGLMLDAGKPLQKKWFPAAPPAITALACKTVSLARRLARTFPPRIPKRRAESEAARALLTVFQHVIPYEEGVADQLIEKISKINNLKTWENRWDLWLDIQTELQRGLNVESSPTFALAWPMDLHRSVGEMLTFYAHCLLPIEERRRAILMTLPVLQSVLTFGSFVTLPLIVLRKSRREVKATVKIIEPTKEFEKSVEDVLSTQSKRLEEVQRNGSSCVCTSYLVSYLKATTPLRRSTGKNKLYHSLLWFTTHFNIEQFCASEFTCDACRSHLKTPTVMEAIKTIRHFSNQTIELARIARRYEHWLLSKGIDLVKKNCGLTTPIHVSKKAVRI